MRVRCSCDHREYLNRFWEWGCEEIKELYYVLILVGLEAVNLLEVPELVISVIVLIQSISSLCMLNNALVLKCKLLFKYKFIRKSYNSIHLHSFSQNSL